MATDRCDLLVKEFQQALVFDQDEKELSVLKGLLLTDGHYREAWRLYRAGKQETAEWVIHFLETIGSQSTMLQRSSLQELRDKPPNDDGDFLEVVRRCGGNGNKPDPDYLAAHCGLILTRLTAAVELGKKAQAIVDKASVLELVETNKIDRLMSNGVKMVQIYNCLVDEESKHPECEKHATELHEDLDEVLTCCYRATAPAGLPDEHPGVTKIDAYKNILTRIYGCIDDPEVKEKFELEVKDEIKDEIKDEANEDEANDEIKN